MSSRKRNLIIGLVVLVVVLSGGAAFIAASLTGRGTRDAVGARAQASSGAVPITYHDHGEGPAVVLLASWARPASDFNELAAALAGAGYRTLAIESRGIGGSRGGGSNAQPSLGDLADDVAAVLRDSGVADDESVHLIGHAFGNRVARSFASRHPERTTSVTLVAAGGRAPSTERNTRALFLSSLTFLPWSMRESELRFAFFAEGSTIPEHWKAGWNLWGGLAQSHAAKTGRHEDFWAAGRAPMLVFQADDDVIARPEDAGLALAAEFPDRVRPVRVPGAGHALLPEQPALIEREVLAFLGEQGTGGRAGVR